MALTDLFIRKVKYAGSVSGEKYSDGRGLYLLVKKANKYWRLNYRYAGVQKTLPLGIYPEVSLAEARDLCDDARRSLRHGSNPHQTKQEILARKEEEAGCTFDELARQWIAKMEKARSSGTQAKVAAWLEHDVIPFIGAMPASTVRPRDILRVIQRVEARGAVDTAHRIRQVCSQIMRFGVATEAVERDVTPDLKGALAVIPRKNHAAITEPAALGALLRSIDDYKGHIVAVSALKLAPLLFVRPGELRAAEWCEVDLDAGEWRIPAAKMKMKAEHMVPLATQAVAILRDLFRATGHGKFVFPSFRTDHECMSENTVNAALRGMGYPKEVMTGHGFRATARTIMDEVLEERVDLIEHQLAHRVIDPNGRAYNRTSHLPARRAMMQRWADYLDILRSGATADTPITRPDRRKS